MIHFTLNGDKVAIPSSWDDVTLNQYCGILKITDDSLKVVSLLSGVNYEIIKNATIIGLDQVIQAISFLNTVPEVPGYTAKVGPYDLPVTKDGKFDIQFESLAQFEDMRKVMQAIPVKDGKYEISGLTRSYPKFVAIYLQKLRDGKYEPEAARLMIPEVEEMPALQVISAGSFFFLKLMSLSTGTRASSPHTNQTPKKSKRASKGSQKSSARTGRSRKRR